MSDQKCRCCCAIIKQGYCWSWNVPYRAIKLPNPPKDLIGAKICFRCWIDGPTMESRIRSQDSIKNSMANSKCGACNCAFEYQDCVTGYTWTNGDSNPYGKGVPESPEDLKGTIICKLCWLVVSSLEQRVRRCISYSGPDTCRVCGAENIKGYNEWVLGNGRIPSAPKDLVYSKICIDCWKDQNISLEVLIRKRDAEIKNNIKIVPKIEGEKIPAKLEMTVIKTVKIVDYWSQPYPTMKRM